MPNMTPISRLGELCLNKQATTHEAPEQPTLPAFLKYQTGAHFSATIMVVGELCLNEQATTPTEQGGAVSSQLVSSGCVRCTSEMQSLDGFEHDDDLDDDNDDD